MGSVGANKVRVITNLTTFNSNIGSVFGRIAFWAQTLRVHEALPTGLSLYPLPSYAVWVFVAVSRAILRQIFWQKFYLFSSFQDSPGELTAPKTTRKWCRRHRIVSRNSRRSTGQRAAGGNVVSRAAWTNRRGGRSGRGRGKFWTARNTAFAAHIGGVRGATCQFWNF